MNITSEQKKAVDRIRRENTFPIDFKWWIQGNEVFLRLDEKTVFGVHASGVVTQHIKNDKEVA
jgi:hypothetical protein